MKSEHWWPGLGFINCQADTECLFELFVPIVRLGGWGGGTQLFGLLQNGTVSAGKVYVQSRYKGTELNHKDGFSSASFFFFFRGGGGVVVLIKKII